jgi:mannosyltransferase OCH1-like enzyme
MFPKRIFQTWKEKKIHNAKLLSWQQSWTEKNKNYEYELWDDADNRLFISQYYPDFLPIYDSYDVNIKRVDAVRYFYLLKYGGIYADLDFVCLQSFDTILSIDADVILGTMGEENIDDSKKSLNNLHNIPNAIMIAKPNSDFFSFVTDMLYHIGGTNPELGPEATTGPIFLKICLLCYTSKSWIDFATLLYKKNIFEEIKHRHTFASKIFITEPTIFYPLNWNNKELMQSREKIFENSATLQAHFPSSFAVTCWMHSW